MYFLFVIVLLCLADTLASPTLKNERIVGGRDAVIEEVPWQASTMVLITSLNCGASIITESWLLSAARCYTNLPLFMYTVRVGSDDFNTGGVSHRIAEIVSHPLAGYPNAHSNDIALIRVVEPIQFSARVQPVALPTLGKFAPIGVLSTISGFGAINSFGTPPKRLQLGHVPVMSNEACGEMHSGFHVTDDMLCAGFERGEVGACLGDAGSPLVADGQLHGVVTFTTMCGLPNFPNIYARVSFFRQWIEDVTGL